MRLIHPESYKFVAILGLICVSEILATSIMPETKGYFFGELEKHSELIWPALGIFCLNYLFLEFIQSLKGFFVIKSSQINRLFISPTILAHVDKMVSAPQRIQEDLKLWQQNTIQVYCEYLISGTIVFILVTKFCIEGNYSLAIGSIIYSLIMIAINKIFNKPMKMAEQIVQQAETEHRDEIRINKSLDLLHDATNANLLANKIRLKFTLFSRMQSLLLVFLPYLTLIPMFLSGKINLGELMAISSSFGLVAINATIIIQMYPLLTQALASKERIEDLIKC